MFGLCPASWWALCCMMWDSTPRGTDSWHQQKETLNTGWRLWHKRLGEGFRDLSGQEHIQTPPPSSRSNGKSMNRPSSWWWICLLYKPEYSQLCLTVCIARPNSEWKITEESFPHSRESVWIFIFKSSRNSIHAPVCAFMKSWIGHSACPDSSLMCYHGDLSHSQSAVERPGPSSPTHYSVCFCISVQQRSNRVETSQHHFVAHVFRFCSSVIWRSVFVKGGERTGNMQTAFRTEKTVLTSHLVTYCITFK